MLDEKQRGWGRFAHGRVPFKLLQLCIKGVTYCLRSQETLKPIQLENESIHPSMHPFIYSPKVFLEQLHYLCVWCWRPRDENDSVAWDRGRNEWCAVMLWVPRPPSAHSSQLWAREVTAWVWSLLGVKSKASNHISTGGWMETLFSYFQPKGEIKLFKNDRSPSGKKPHSDLEKADSKHLNEQGVKKILPNEQPLERLKINLWKSWAKVGLISFPVHCKLPIKLCLGAKK